METPEEFKRLFSFLERTHGLPLRNFSYAKDCFGNIVAEYGGNELLVRLIRDRGLVETEISSDGIKWVPLDHVLTAAGAPPSVTTVYANDTDYFGHFIGRTAVGQATDLQNHFSLIKQHLVGA